MPEGPEIWRTADKLNRTLKNKVITDIFFSFEKLKEFETKLKDKKVEKVEARGKAMLTFFEGDWTLYSHNQLYGKWLFGENGEEPDTNRKLRVAIRNQSGGAYLYSASQIEMLPKDEITDHSYIQKLGPDVLHPETSYEDIMQQFHEETFQNRKLTTLLLDQGFVSGIGNYLRSEIMFYAGVNPRKKLKQYSGEEKEELARATYKLTMRSYETGGITNDEKIVEALKRENATRQQYRHFVYKRTDDFCHKCGSKVEEEKTGGRKIYFCTPCQIGNG